MSIVAKTQNENNALNEDKKNDRYVSFCGIDCDLKSDKLMSMLEDNINAGHGDERWHAYFTQKRALQKKLQHDNLNFVGHQTNTLYEYFDLCGDQEAKDLLWQIEQNCC